MGLFNWNFSNASTTIINNALTKLLNKKSTELIADASSSAYASAEVVWINRGVVACGGTMRISADAKSMAKSLADISQLSDSEFSSQITKDLSTEVEQELEQTNESGWFDFGNINFGNTLSKQITENEDIIENIINEVIRSHVHGDSESHAKVEIINEGLINVEGNCEFNANAFAESISQLIATQISQIVSNSDAFVEISARSTQSQKQIIDGTWGMIMIAIILVVFIGGAGYVATDENLNETARDGIEAYKSSIIQERQQGGKMKKRKIKQTGGYITGMVRKWIVRGVIFIGLCFIAWFVIKFLFFDDELQCSDGTEIGPKLIAGGNTEREQHECEDGLNKNPPEIKKFEDKGGACDLPDGDPAKQLHPSQKCDDEEYLCAYCPNGEPLEKRWYRIFRWVSFWGSIISIIILIILSMTK